MSFNFDAFSGLVSAHTNATQIAFHADPENGVSATTEVRFIGTGLSYNASTGTMAGKITSIVLYDTASGTLLQTMKVGPAAILASNISQFLHKAMSISNAIDAWVTSANHLDFDNVVFAPDGKTVSVPILSGSNALQGYFKLNGTGLTDGGFDNGHITSIVHENTSHVPIPGDNLSYAGIGDPTTFFQYGLLKYSGGTNGNDEVINSVLNAGNDTIIATGIMQSSDLQGGLGNDTYVLGSFEEPIKDAGGIDTVTSTVSRNLNLKIASMGVDYTAMEKLVLLGSSDINGTGNSRDNSIDGNDGNNALDGGGGNDTLMGMGGNDSLKGGGGHDTIKGGLGDDWISGQAGDDKLGGGYGNDVFLFNSALNAATNVDKIIDFSSAKVGNDDTILLENTGAGLFNALAAGTLSAAAFAKGAGFVSGHDTTDRIIYNTATGDLFYDKDGLGGAAAVKFATLTTHPTPLTYLDFVVI